MQIFFTLALIATAAFFGTITGFGTSTLLIPLLVDQWGGQETLLFVALVHWFGDLTKLIFFYRSIDRRIALIVALPALLAAFGAGFLPAHLSFDILKRLIAGVIALYGLLALFGIQPRVVVSFSSLVAGGILSGILSAITGIGGMVRGAFLSTLDISSYAYIATLATIGCAIDSARIGAYLISGSSLSSEHKWLLIYALPVSFGAIWMGRYAVQNLDPQLFKKIVGFALCILALRLLYV